MAGETRADSGRGPIWAVAPLLAMALICVVFAFVGLGVSSYSVDELFSLFLIDHGGGPSQVIRLALTDTHPPAYYLALWSWAQAFGASEGALRLFSAVCAAGALAVFYLGIRRRFSLAAAAFALALGAGSKLFFEEAQEVRNYAPGLLVSAGLLSLTLAIHRRISEGRAAGWPLWLALWLVGLLAAFTHFYLLLEVGAVHLFLLITARSLRTRGIVVLSGLTILIPELAYIAALLRGTEQNIQAMWFSNAPGALAKQALGGLTQAWSQLAIGAVALLGLAVLVRPRRPWPQPALLALCGLAILGVLAAGLTVSFALAPSFGRKNLIFVGPFFWLAGAWLWDAAALDPKRPLGVALIAAVVLLTVSNGLTVLTRRLSRNEPWRESAAYVDAEPGCAEASMPVVLPFLFGPPTPFFRQLAEDRFFGHYDRWPDRLSAYTPQEFAPALASPTLRTLLAERTKGGCKVLAWGVHDLDAPSVAAIRQAVAATAGVPQDRVRVKAFDRQKPGLLGTSSARPNAYVFERAP